MLVFGHVGLTVAAVRTIDPDADLRAPAVFALLPDLIDKPVALLLPHLVHGNTRNFGHGALAAALVLALLLAARRRVQAPLILWACFTGHLLLDRMWLEPGPTILLWPFAGPFPVRLPGSPKTPHLILYDAVGEALGLTLLVLLARRHRLLERPRWDAFVRTGRLPESGSSLQHERCGPAIPDR